MLCAPVLEQCQAGWGQHMRLHRQRPATSLLVMKALHTARPPHLSSRASSAAAGRPDELAATGLLAARRSLISLMASAALCLGTPRACGDCERERGGVAAFSASSASALLALPSLLRDLCLCLLRSRELLCLPSFLPGAGPRCQLDWGGFLCGFLLHAALNLKTKCSASIWRMVDLQPCL